MRTNSNKNKIISTVRLVLIIYSYFITDLAALYNYFGEDLEQVYPRTDAHRQHLPILLSMNSDSTEVCHLLGY